jgi:hypothetical protein
MTQVPDSPDRATAADDGRMDQDAPASRAAWTLGAFGGRQIQQLAQQRGYGESNAVHLPAHRPVSVEISP